MSPVLDQLRSDLTTAMRARRRSEVTVLRTVLAALANAEAQDPASERPVERDSSGPIAGAAWGAGSTDIARRQLSEDQVLAVIRAERDEMVEVAETLAASGAESAATRLREEALLLGRYL